MSTILQSINASASPEVQANENFETLSVAGIFGKRQPVTTGLTWGYYGGVYNGNTVANGTVTLTNTATNYVVVKRSDGVVSVATTTTNWLNIIDYARLYQLTVAGGLVTAVVDARMDFGGLLNGFSLGLQQNIQSAAYTLVLADRGKHLLHPSADTTARTWTIPANSAVAFPIGTPVKFVNQDSAGVITIAITTDTMRLAGAGTTGSRTLAANGIADALKLTATEWIITGVGLT